MQIAIMDSKKKNIRFFPIFNCQLLLVYYFAILFGWVSMSQALKQTSVQVPAIVLAGHHVDLDCQYLLEGAIYSVKWYKDNAEFYSYTIMDQSPPNIITSAVPGINLDPFHSNLTRVRLRAVSLETSGVYGCEVTVEDHSFSSYYNQSNMAVIQLAKEDPQIDGNKDTYFSGEELNVNCTASPKYHPKMAYPQQRFVWRLNKQMIPELPNGDNSKMIRLKLKLSREHFDQNGLLHLSCTFIIGNVLNQTAEFTAKMISHSNTDPCSSYPSTGCERSASYASVGHRHSYNSSWVFFIICSILSKFFISM